MRAGIVLLACFSLIVWKGSAQSDALGVHNIYGRGCAACHAPHIAAESPGGGQIPALWGQDLTPLYGRTVPAGGFSSRTAVSLPVTALRRADARDSNSAIITCLSCHDGCMAPVGSMKGVTVEPVSVDGRAPSLLPGASAGGEHPVGSATAFGCGASGKWDCSISAGGEVSMNGTYSSRFARNYGFPIAFKAGRNGSTLTCTTCHNPHSETVWAGTIGGRQANWRTSFFVRGPYTPDGSGRGNAAAQFCRSCHAAQSNEMQGLMNVPTTGISRL